MSEEKIAIVGTGRVGTALTRALYETGYNVAVVYDTDMDKARAIAAQCGNMPQVVPMEEFPTDLGLVFFTVTDDELTSIIEQAAVKIPVTQGTIVAHCSGAYSSELLTAFQPATPLLASMHPVQSFPGTQDDWKRFFGIYFGLEGNEEALKRLQHITKVLQSRHVIIPTDKKVLYHVGCVMASNYLVSLISGSLSIMDHVGFNREDAFKIIQPLVLNTFENIKKNGPAGAATGPITRGDMGTVKRHLQDLQDLGPLLNDAYRNLGLLLIDTVYENPGSSKKTLDDIRGFLLSAAQDDNKNNNIT